MKSMRANRLILFLTLTSVLLAPNCATLTKKRLQRIPVTSSPAGAAVSVNGFVQGWTPLEIRLVRKKNQVIRIESPGYNPVEIRLKRGLSGNAILSNLVIGLGVGTYIGLVASFDPGISKKEATLIGALGSVGMAGIFTAIDILSNKAYKLKPTELVVTLTKADGPPRVDTILIDADDLQNVKWIRILRN